MTILDDAADYHRTKQIENAAKAEAKPLEQHHCPCCGLPASDNAPDDPDICHKHPHCYVCWGREHDLVGDCIACKAGLR